MDYLFQMLVVYAADDVNQTTVKTSEPRNKKPIVGSKFSDDIKKPKGEIYDESWNRDYHNASGTVKDLPP